MKLAYLRVSSEDQNLARQEDAIKPYKVDKVYIDKISGKNIMERPQLNDLLDYAREGDQIIVVSFDRLARNARHLLEIVDKLEAKGVELISIKENLDTSTPIGRLMLTMLGGLAELERSNIRERQAHGIKLAKERGVYKGRQEIKLDDKFIALYNKYLNKEIETKKELAEVYGVSRPTIYKLIKEHEAGLTEA